jgi:TPR repeat protein
MDSSIALGSAPEGEIVLDGEAVLPRHCVLRRIGEQRFQISRAVPEARFTVNGVTASELEVETPFQFGIGDELITFDLAAEGTLLPEVPAWDEPVVLPASPPEPAPVAEPAAAAEPEPAAAPPPSDEPVAAEEAVEILAPTEWQQVAARAGRRDYLLQPNIVRPRTGERLGEVLIDLPPLFTAATETSATPAASKVVNEPLPNAKKAEAEGGSPLVFASLMICVAMIAAIFYWQHHLDSGAQETEMVLDSPEPGMRDAESDTVLKTVMSLRRASLPMISTHLAMPLAEEGDARAMHELALALLASGEFSEEAVYLLRQAAESGERDALADLTEAVENPLNMARYSPDSFQHLSFAAHLGESSAWMPMGDRYEHGHGVARNLERALAAYEKAHAAGERRAATKLAAKREALGCVAAFVRSWNEPSVASLSEHVSAAPERFFEHEKPSLETLMKVETQLRSWWPQRRISVEGDGTASLHSFERVEVMQPFQFELQRGERIARGRGLLTCAVAREEAGWRVVSAQDEIALNEMLPAGDQFTAGPSLRSLKPALTPAERVEQLRLEILETMRGLEATQDFKPALSIISEAVSAFPQEAFWRPFVDKLCDRMAREFFRQGRWQDGSWATQVRQLAATGSVSAILLEGHLRMAGYGGARDERHAVELYQKAFEIGRRRDARFYYAEALFEGRGLPQDLEKAGLLILSSMTRSKHPLEAFLAAQWLWLKAERDPSLWPEVHDILSRVAEKHPPARHLAAVVMLNHGKTSRERRSGFIALKAAAEAGVLEAMKNLSKCYQDGVGCEKDFQAAMLWKQKAAVTEPSRRRHYTEFEG